MNKDKGTCVPTDLQFMERLARISPPDNWRKVVRPLINAYNKATGIATKRSAHRVAYEAAFSQLFNQELGSDAKSKPRQPEIHAMRMARINMGQPKPIADQRYRVEAMWASIEIRFTLADLGTVWLRALPKKNKSTDELRHRWSMFALFIYKSALHDAFEALNTAKGTSSHRQIAQCSIFIARAEFELFRFNHGISDARMRENFKKQVDIKIGEFKARISAARRAYIAAMPANANWFDETQGKVVQTLMDAWEGLHRMIHDGHFYSEVTREEKEAIIAAFR